MNPEYFLWLTLPDDDDYTHHLDSAVISSLEARMEMDREIDPAWLVIDTAEGNLVVGHEGRHRAAAAMRLGLREIPVMVIIRFGGMYQDVYAHPEERIDPNRDEIRRQYHEDEEW